MVGAAGGASCTTVGHGRVRRGFGLVPWEACEDVQIVHRAQHKERRVGAAPILEVRPDGGEVGVVCRRILVGRTPVVCPEDPEDQWIFLIDRKSTDHPDRRNNCGPS
jgi:hypothetical protein